MPIRLEVLGGLRGFRDQEQLGWVPAQRIRSALLLYLGLERRATREQLIHVFWPNEEPEHARHALSQTVYLLRQALGDSCIETDRAMLHFRSPLECDAWEFEHAVDTSDFATACALYRGSFLKDLSLSESREFEDWVDAERARLARLHRRARRGHIDALLEAGGTLEALETARTWASVEPFEDEAQHRLVGLLAATGQRTEALEQFAAFERRLAAEALEPLEETKALVSQLRAGDADVVAERALAPAGSAPAVPSPSSGSPQQHAEDSRRMNAAGAGPGGHQHRRWPARGTLAFGLVPLALVAAAAVLALWPRGQQARPSLAVLPCLNLSGISAEEYLGDGFAEDLINALGRVEGLVTSARTSSFAFKNRDESTRAIADALRVDYLLECSIRRQGDRIVVNAALMNPREHGYQLWSERYEGAFKDLLTVQASIVGAIVGELKIELLAQQEGRLVTGGSANPDAYAAYLQGVTLMEGHLPQHWPAAIENFRRATELDPDYARAHANLAFAALYQSVARGDSVLEALAYRSALRALQLDSSLAQPHLVLFRREFARRDWQAARRELETAIRKEPGSRWVSYYSASFLGNHMGERRRAVAEIEHLLALDPLSPASHCMAAQVLAGAGEYERADAVASLALKLDSLGFGAARKDVVATERFWSHLYRGRYEEAIAFFDSWAEFFPRLAPREIRDLIHVALTGIAGLHRDPEHAREARLAGLAAVRTLEGSPTHILEQWLVVHLAVLYLLLDDHEGMYRVLERAEREGWNLLPQILNDAAFDPVRDEPRFVALQMKLGLPPVIVAARAGAG